MKGRAEESAGEAERKGNNSRRGAPPARDFSVSPPPLGGRTAGLTKFLIAKSILEALFVVALAVGFYRQAFNFNFHGYVEPGPARRLSGWVVDGAQPHARIEVQLYIDGLFVAGGHTASSFSTSSSNTTSSPSTLPHAGAQAEGSAASRVVHHPFSFDLPQLAAGSHEAHVYAVHQHNWRADRRTLHLIGRPVRFQIEPAQSVGTAPPEAEP